VIRRKDKESGGSDYYVVLVPVAERYYLFYDLEKHSFHTPIEKSDLEKYPDLGKVYIDALETRGEDILELISTQFVEKVLTLIESGNYTYAG
jgi:hypothetical protein